MIHSRSHSPCEMKLGFARDEWVGKKQIPEGLEALTKPLWMVQPFIRAPAEMWKHWRCPGESDQDRDHLAAS